MPISIVLNTIKEDKELVKKTSVGISEKIKIIHKILEDSLNEVKYHRYEESN